MPLADNSNFIDLQITDIKDDHFASGGVQLKAIIRTDLELDKTKEGYNDAAVQALIAACEEYRKESGTIYKLVTV